MKWNALCPLCFILLSLGCDRSQGLTSKVVETQPAAPSIGQQLTDFLAGDPFTYEDKYWSPNPTRPTSTLFEYGKSHYLNDSALRHAFALYYLRYDAARMYHGHRTQNTSADDLIGLMWKLEVQLHHIGSEGPALWEMRRGMRKYPEWFSLTLADQATIRRHDEANEALGLDNAKMEGLLAEEVAAMPTR